MRIDESKKYEEGETLVITGGCHDDYEISAVFRVDRSFDAKELSEIAPLNVDFETWLIVKGYIVELRFKELHIYCDEVRRVVLSYKK